MMKIIVMLFLIGHFLGDFYFQSDQIAAGKDKSFNKLLIHGLVYLLTMVLIIVPIFGFTFLKWVLIVSLIHIGVDWLKMYLTKKRKPDNKMQIYAYMIDQLIHVVTILALVALMASVSKTFQFSGPMKKVLEMGNFDIEMMLKWTLSSIIVIKPVSITIGKLLYKYQPKTMAKEEVGHPGAGSLIGILERLIILMMLSQNQYAAIGFVLTAKSIARYNKLIENPQFSEYYLLGTLLSILLVIATHTILFI